MFSVNMNTLYFYRTINAVWIYNKIFKPLSKVRIYSYGKKFDF